MSPLLQISTLGCPTLHERALSDSLRYRILEIGNGCYKLPIIPESFAMPKSDLVILDASIHMLCKK